MKLVTMALSAQELDALADVWTEKLEREKRSPKDPDLRADLDMLLRLQGAAHRGGYWPDASLYAIPWAVPVLRKALADAGRVPDLERRVKQLEADLKLAKKPAPKPKPRPKKPLPAKVLPHNVPAAEKPVPVVASP